MIQKAFKYRIYPTPEQEVLISKTFGCCRYVYNYGLAKIKENYERDKTRIKIADISKEIPFLKKTAETEWLSEVPAVALIFTLRNLDSAFKNFFRQVKSGQKAGYPKFKSRFDRNQSYQFHQGYSIDMEQGTMDIPKIKGLKVLFHRQFIGIPKTCTISKNPCGEYYISILVECVGDVPEKTPIKTQTTTTIHLGLRNFAYVNSNGTTKTIEHPKFLIKSLGRVKVLNKRLSHRKEVNKGKTKDDVFTGANIEKARLKLAQLHNKIKTQREAFLHNLSTQLIQQNPSGTILVENWKVSEMIKDKYLSKYIADSGWRMFWNMNEYKSDWNGLNFIQADKDFASSKTCSECGYHNAELKMQITWICPICNTKHDREENAINNLINLNKPAKQFYN